MAIPYDTTSSPDLALKRLERERREESDARATVWAFLWVLFGFKIATVGIIWYVAAGSGESVAMIAATTWYWLVIPIGAISGPLLFRWRMIKVRRRREALRQAEWNVAPGSPDGPSLEPPTPRDREGPESRS